MSVHKNTIHGRRYNPEYNIWNHMKIRCSDKLDKDYGGRGISVCEEWKNSFMAFYSRIGERPSSKHQLDRIDNNGNYEPGNVRWATRKEQSSNRRTNIVITYNGETMILKDWSEKLNMSYGVLRKRIRKGWDVHTAFNTPISKENNHGNKIILDTQTGIFYDGAKEALRATNLKSNVEYFRRCLIGDRKNKTSMMYV